jgi:hypothetical protein
MGLLDEAIREHLELKRRRGAEPVEIAQVEREALDPGVEGFPATFGDGSDAQLLERTRVEQPGDGHASGQSDGSVAEHEAEAPEHGYGAAVSTLTQETVELDMQALMDEDIGAETASSGGAVVAEPLGDGFSVQWHQEAALDWEAPVEHASMVHSPGHESTDPFVYAENTEGGQVEEPWSASFDRDEHAGDPAQDAEQERLSFE